MGRLDRQVKPAPIPSQASAVGDDGALADLIRRTPRSLAPGNVLAVNCPGPSTARALLELHREGTVDFIIRDFSVHAAISRAVGREPGVGSCILGCWDPPPAAYGGALIFLPKGRAHAEMDLSLAAASVKAGGTVSLVGRLKEGVRTGRDALARLCGPITAGESARHALLAVAVRGDAPTPRGSLSDWETAFSIDAPGGPLRARSFPGVFSHGRLDPGTALLLAHLPAEPSVRVLDLGCGCGAIGGVLARAWPGSHIHLSDSSALAVESARRTLLANGLNNADACLADGYPEEGAKYGLIVSNPPFHAGARPDFSVLRGLWNGAPAHLEPRGRLLIVLTGGIPGGVMDERLFQRVRQLARQGPYRVIEATK